MCLNNQYVIATAETQHKKIVYNTEETKYVENAKNNKNKGFIVVFPLCILFALCSIIIRT